MLANATVKHTDLDKHCLLSLWAKKKAMTVFIGLCTSIARFSPRFSLPDKCRYQALSEYEMVIHVPD